LEPVSCSYCFPIGSTLISYGHPIGGRITDKLDIQQGTLSLMILRTVEVLGPLHGYGIARRIEETSANRILLNYGTLYPALLKLEQEGFIKAKWGTSENNRKAKFYGLTAAGRKRLEQETNQWRETADLIAAFLALRPEA
jgi:PadR family transcriptional regulator, regulatory protein PadR